MERGAMRVLVAVVLTLAVVWGGYWFIGSRALERGVEAWFANQLGTGLVAERESLAVQGFPNRFDLTINGLHIADTATGFGWTAPFVQVLTLSYKPWHVIVAFPNEQQINTPLEGLMLTSSKLQGSLVVTPNRNLPLDRTAVVGSDLGLTSTLGWSVAAKTLRLATKRVAPDGKLHEIGFEILGLSPDAALTAAVPELPELIEKLRLDAEVGLTAPLDRNFGQTPPHVESIDVKEMSMAWGELGLFGKGRVAANEDGLAEGRIELRVTNWRAALPLAVALGLVTPEVRPTWENVLALLASRSGDPDDLDLPLSFQNGRMSLGPLPLGPAPAMR